MLGLMLFILSSGYRVSFCAAQGGLLAFMLCIILVTNHPLLFIVFLNALIVSSNTHPNYIVL